MRSLSLGLAAVLALTLPIFAHAGQPGSKTRAGGVASGPAWHPAPGQMSQWRGGWRPPGSGPAVPTYWVWGPSGGAFDYPFSDWRGPTGGWGNP